MAPTIRKSVRNDVREIIPFLIKKVIDWMKIKYPDVNFDNTDFIFSSNYNRSRYFRNEITNGNYIRPNTCISTRAQLMLYNKKSLKIKRNEIFVGSKIQMECALVHELTHHVQYEKNERKGNELDTTKNELEYLFAFYPEIYKRIML